MEVLINLNQLKVGTKLRVVGDGETKTYPVIKIIPMKTKDGDGSLPSAGPNDTEILLNNAKNIYFSMNKFLAGTSWAKEIYVLKAKEKDGI